ncbi:hypothetical protein GQ53DRAFT_749200 [Thozetella sp. PMI_491]|nr:hypothetical protein GQ53DRAFT_749200 [Thozetella sp. PMI_491]
MGPSPSARDPSRSTTCPPAPLLPSHAGPRTSLGSLALRRALAAAGTRPLTGRRTSLIYSAKAPRPAPVGGKRSWVKGGGGPRAV